MQVCPSQLILTLCVEQHKSLQLLLVLSCWWMMACREVTTGTLGYFVHIQPSTLLTRSLQVPAPLAAQSTKDDDLTYRSRESICCTVPSSNGSRKMMLYCNSADDPRYVVTPCAGYEAEDLSRRGLVLYSKRETCAELEVAVPTSLSLEGEGQSVVVPPGQVVEVIRRVGHWVKIRVLLQPAAGHDDKCFDEDVNGERSAAVVGWAELFSHVPSAHGKRGGVSAARSGSNYSYMTNLTPLKDLEFARHGQAHPFMSSCGHAIHADCWDTYMASCLSSHINSRGFNRMSFMNPEIGEVSLLRLSHSCVLPRALLYCCLTVSGLVSHVQVDR